MECCIGVSTETVLQVVKFYTVVKKNYKRLTFRTVVLRRSEKKSATVVRKRLKDLSVKTGVAELLPIFVSQQIGNTLKHRYFQQP